MKSPRKECRLQAGVLQALGSLGLARQVRVCVLSLTRASHPSCLPTSYCCCCGIIASMLQAYFFFLCRLFSFLFYWAALPALCAFVTDGVGKTWITLVPPVDSSSTISHLATGYFHSLMVTQAGLHKPHRTDSVQLFRTSNTAQHIHACMLTQEALSCGCRDSVHHRPE